jgi:uncharacterized protein (TIGR02996 family)
MERGLARLLFAGGEKRVSDGEALIRSILATPADDAPRLVYADWLDEQGRAEDAEFIRVQVELARLGFSGGFHKDETGRLRHVPAHVERLTERQLELWFAGHGRPNLPPEMTDWPVTVHPTPGHSLLLCRGFVERITIHTSGFLRLAGGLFARQPVMHVRLGDCQPSSTRAGFGRVQRIGGGRLDQIPDELWALVYSEDAADRTFPTADAAEAALSWACVRYGRAQAGLE